MAVPNLLSLVDINYHQQQICYRILTTTPELRAGLDKVKAAIGDPDIINQENQYINRDFKAKFCDGILSPLNNKYMDYILAFGFVCVEWVQDIESTEPKPRIMDFGEYDVKQQRLPNRDVQYFCFRRNTVGTMYTGLVPDLNVTVIVEDPPTIDGDLTSRFYTIYRTIMFNTTIDHAEAKAELVRTNPLLLTETRESIQSADNVSDLSYYTPGDHIEIAAQRQAGIQITAVKSAAFASMLAERANSGMQPEVFQDPVSGIPTLENFVAPNYRPSMFQLPPDQKLVNQQLPVIRSDLIDLKDHLISIICAILQLPVSICFPSRTRATVADTEQDNAQMEMTISRWKATFRKFDERIYETLYGSHDREHYAKMLSDYEIARLRAIGTTEDSEYYGFTDTDIELSKANALMIQVLNKEEAPSSKVKNLLAAKRKVESSPNLDIPTDTTRSSDATGNTNNPNKKQRIPRQRRQRTAQQKKKRVSDAYYASSTSTSSEDDADMDVSSSASEEEEEKEKELVEQLHHPHTHAEATNNLPPQNTASSLESERVEDYKTQKGSSEQMRTINAGLMIQKLASEFEPHDEVEGANYWNMTVHTEPSQDIIVPSRKATNSSNKKQKRSSRKGEVVVKAPTVPSVRVIFPGVIPQAQLNSLYQRGLIQPATYRKYVATAMGLPEETLMLPPLPDIIWQRIQETEQLNMQKQLQGHTIELQNDQNQEQKRSNRQMEKANREAAKNGLAAAGGGGGAGGGGAKKPATAGSAGKASVSTNSASSASKTKSSSSTSQGNTARKATRSKTQSLGTNASARDKTAEMEVKQKNKDKDKVKKPTANT